MKAILAFTSRHALVKSGDRTTNLHEPLQYYYETLHYVQESLRYASYTRSEELLATVIIISAYEMLDDGRGDWQRHLKGVFGIQRSQNVNGASGGLRQAVWWAWLRQDLWAAFRAKRACFSFWRPLKAVSDLTKDELVNRAVFLLSQAVNFVAHSESTSRSASDKAQTGETIMAALAEWQACLGPEFRPLPTVESETAVFKPLWLHPPHYALALQAYHFAKILVTLHRPASAGFQGYLQTQRVLSQSVEVICGIAMELKDEGCQVSCSQSLFAAGLCTQDSRSRETIIALIEICGARSGWPMSNLIHDLRAEWARMT